MRSEFWVQTWMKWGNQPYRFLGGRAFQAERTATIEVPWEEQPDKFEQGGPWHGSTVSKRRGMGDGFTGSVGPCKSEFVEFDFLSCQRQVSVGREELFWNMHGWDSFHFNWCLLNTSHMACTLLYSGGPKKNDKYISLKLLSLVEKIEKLKPLKNTALSTSFFQVRVLHRSGPAIFFLEAEGRLTVIHHETPLSQQDGVTAHFLTFPPATHLSGEEKTPLALQHFRLACTSGSVFHRLEKVLECSWKVVDKLKLGPSEPYSGWIPSHQWCQ